MYDTVSSRLLADDYPLLRYEVMLHSSSAISVHCHYQAKQVGFTLWPGGDAEMTWETDPGRCCITYYEIGSPSDLDRFLADLQARLAS